MVVLFHVTSFVSGDPRYWHVPGLSDHFAGFALGVEYFFVLSGTVILLAHLRDIGHPATIPSYFWKRFRRVYPIYWLVLAAVVAQYILRPGAGAAWETNPWTILSGALLFQVHGYSYNLNLPVAWTLFHEVLFYLVFTAFLFSRRIGLTVLTLWCVASIATMCFTLPLYFGAYLFSPLHLLFAMGMLAAWLLRTRKVPAASLLTATGLATFVAAVVLAAFHKEIDTPIELLAGLGAALIVLGACRLEEHGRLAIPTPLKFLGDSSYSLYLVHYPFFMALTPILYRLTRHHPLPVAILFILMTILATAAGCLTHVLLERPLLNWLNTTRRPAPQPEDTTRSTSTVIA